MFHCASCCDFNFTIIMPLPENSEDCEYETVYFDIIEFLTAYELLPCLWDRTHEQFRNRTKRLKCEEILGEKFGISDLRILRRKIRSIRGSYNTEIRKIKQCLESGGVPYPPKLSWFPIADKFLRSTTDLPYELFSLCTDESPLAKRRKFQKLPRNKEVKHFYVSTPIKQPKMDENQRAVEEINQDRSYKEDCYEMYEEIETLEESESLDHNSQDGVAGVKFQISDDFDQDSASSSNTKTKMDSNQNQGLNNIVTYLKDLTSDNEFIQFGRSVGIQLKNMPLDLALQLQMDIQTHILKTRLEYLQQTQKQTESE